MGKVELTIYLADLTHDSVGLATEVFPLNIGFVAANCMKRFEGSVDIKLFKYVADLERAILHHPPDILGLSNYVWCHNVSIAMFRLLAERRPDALRVMGGPNFPHDFAQQKQFLLKRPVIDTYCFLDGEDSFVSFIEFVLRNGNLSKCRKALGYESIPGCIHLDAAGEVHKGIASKRLKNLDEIPSPYLLGLLDQFFDGRLYPMLQTNRGCPFQCTFCHDGSALVNKVNQFSVERVKAELQYVVEHVPPNIKTLFVSDLNFGMYARDGEICDEIARLKQQYDYPWFIDTTTGKNSKRRVINNVEKLAGALGVTMSVQSMTPEVLEHVKRDNMKLDDFFSVKPAIQSAGLHTNAEVILGLPGETIQGHIESIDALLSLEMDHVLSYTLMMLNGTELNSPKERKRWGYKTKYRVIPRDFTQLANGENIVEIEEVVVESNTMSFKEYVHARKFVILVQVINNTGLKPLLRFLLQCDIKIGALVQALLSSLDREEHCTFDKHHQHDLYFFLKEYERETRDELWDDEEDLVAFFQSKENFDGLLSGKYGSNLIQTYKAKIWVHCFEELLDKAFSSAACLFHERNLSNEVSECFSQLRRYCRARTFKFLDSDRLETIPEEILSYDIHTWTADPGFRPIEEFRWKRARRVQFPLPKNKYDYLEELLDQFGRDDLGLGKALIRVSPDTLWRTPITD